MAHTVCDDGRCARYRTPRVPKQAVQIRGEPLGFTPQMFKISLVSSGWHIWCVRKTQVLIMNQLSSLGAFEAYSGIDRFPECFCR